MVWGLIAEHSWVLPIPALVGFVGFIVSLPGFRAMGLALGERRRHAEAGHCFLCPSCFHYGDFQFGCGRCRSELDELYFYMGWTCPTCARIPPAPGDIGTGEPIGAYCTRCRRVVEASLFHGRRVRVIAVLTAADLDAFCEAHPRRNWVRHPDGAVADDGASLHWVLDLSARYEGAAAFTHSLHTLEAVWTDGRHLEPLALGEMLDRMLRSGGFPEARWRQITVCVGMAELPPAVRNTLEGRFDLVRYGVPAGEFLRCGHEAEEPEGTPAEEERERPRLLHSA